MAAANGSCCEAVSFLRSENFLLRNSAIRAMRCKTHSLGLPMIRNAAQRCENLCNSLGLNYKSAALNQLSYAGVSPYESRF